MGHEKPSCACGRLGADGIGSGIQPSVASKVTNSGDRSCFPPISEYALIGDMQACALVSSSGSIDWLCLPNIADPPLFSGLLGRWGGRFRICPDGDCAVEQGYLGETPVLRTRFIQGKNCFSVTDFLTLRTEGLDGPIEPERELLRIVEVESGTPSVAFHFEPRPGFGNEPRLERRGRNAWACQHEADLILFRNDFVTLDADDRHVSGLEQLEAGDKRYFSLSFCRRDIGVIPGLGPECEAKKEAARDWWTAWLSQAELCGSFDKQVKRSLVALRLLTSRETGAVAAAPTTSLPEWIGGQRNWDYRYCWMRDAYFVLSAFMQHGYENEASAYFNWLMHATEQDKPDLRPVYDIFGRSNLKEKEISQLEGYRNSAPVRTGNGASAQVQLDSYGSVMLAARSFVDHGGTFGASEARRLRGFVETVCRRWREPDNGIWEMRQGRLHHLYSKAMCWSALDSALWLADRSLLRLNRDAVCAERAALEEVVCRSGWNEDRGAFTGAIGCEHLDASVLLLPKIGIIRADHPRMVATFEKIDAELSKGPFVWRYDPSVDGHGSPEGAFVACCFWAVEYLAMAGRLEEALTRIRSLTGVPGELGLWSEEYDPDAGEMLGNMPQGLSHAALLHAVRAIDEAHKSRIE